MGFLPPGWSRSVPTVATEAAQRNKKRRGVCDFRFRQSEHGKAGTLKVPAAPSGSPPSVLPEEKPLSQQGGKVFVSPASLSLINLIMRVLGQVGLVSIQEVT